MAKELTKIGIPTVMILTFIFSVIAWSHCECREHSTINSERIIKHEESVGDTLQSVNKALLSINKVLAQMEANEEWLKRHIERDHIQTEADVREAMRN